MAMTLENSIKLHGNIIMDKNEIGRRTVMFENGVTRIYDPTGTFTDTHPNGLVVEYTAEGELIQTQKPTPPPPVIVTVKAEMKNAAAAAKYAAELDEAPDIIVISYKVDKKPTKRRR